MRRGLAFVGVLLVAGASIGHADEKADSLVQQVQQSIRSIMALAADYTITLTDRDEKLTAHVTRIYKNGGNIYAGLGVERSTPTGRLSWSVVTTDVSTLCDPTLSTPLWNDETKPSLHYLGPEHIQGTSYEVIAALYVVSQWETVREKWYISPDKHLHHITGQIFLKLLPNQSQRKSMVLNIECAVTYRAPTHNVPRPSDADPVRAVEVHSDAKIASIWAIIFSPDGKALAVGNYNGTVQLFDPATWQSSRLLVGHTGPIESVAFSPDGSLLATASADRSVRLWDPRTGKTVLTLPGEDNSTFSVAFSPDGKLLATQHQGVHLWDVTSGREVKILEGKMNEAMRVEFSPDGRLLAVGGTDNSVELWNARTWQLERTLDGRSLKGKTGTVMSLAFSPDSKLLAIGSKDGITALWATTTGQLVHTLKNALGPVSTVAFSPDGQTLAVGENDETVTDERPGHNAGVTLWDTGSWQLVRTMAPRDGTSVDCLAISPDSATLVTCDNWQKRFKVWTMARNPIGVSH